MKYDVFGIGNTLIDLMYQVGDEHLLAYKLKKGVMHLLDDEQIEQVLSGLEHEKIVPAGATTNTLMGISALGGKCVLFGKVGMGALGDMYEEIITKEGIQSRLLRSRSHRTGRVIALVTPDAERTFGVNLGASPSVAPKEMLEDDLRQSRFFYFTGYEFESMNPTVGRAMEIAKGHSVRVAMDLADPELVRRNFRALKKIVRTVDILFLNEREAMSFTDLEPEGAAMRLGCYVRTVVVKNGEKGSLIVHNGRLHRVNSEKAKAVDTTGAGDLYAAGFLWGRCQGKSIDESGRMGSILGAKIVEQVGALMTEKTKQEVQLLLQKP